MEKLKKLNGIIMTLVLLVITSGILIVYDNVKKHTINNVNPMETQLSEELEIFTLTMAKEVNPDYQIINYSDQLDQSLKNEIEQAVEEGTRYTQMNLGRDENLCYEFKNTKTGKTVSHNMDKANQKEQYLYMKLTFDEQGKLNVEGKDSILTSPINVKQFLQRYLAISYVYEDGVKVNDYMIEGTQVSESKLSINELRDIEITYAIPKDLVKEGYIYSNLNSFQHYNGFSALALLIASAMIGVFILFYPIRNLEKIQPFVTIKKCKFEFLCFSLTFIIFLGTLGVMVLTGNTLNDFFSNLLVRYEIKYLDFIIWTSNYVAWFLLLYVIAVAFFEIKYIFAHGVWRYCKEDTFVGTCFHKAKQKMNSLLVIDLSAPGAIQILKIVAVHTLILLCLTAMWWLGWLLLIPYAIGVYGWLMKKFNQVQKDYVVVTDAMKELGNGNFDVNIKEDVGMFQSMKEEFKNIRNGFETAVQEETKSQNMKTELISNVSHDLKTPITCMKNYIVLLQNEQLDEEKRKEYVACLNQYINRLTVLIEDLFDVSKVNSGNMKLDLMDLNIIALIQQAQAECSDLLEEKQLTVISNIPESEIILHLDGGKTYRIFENLFTNISRYAMAHSRVYLDVQLADHEVTIVFKNISQTQMNFTSEEIVDRFVRGDKSRHEGGSGLGLAIVKSFVEVQGGTFRIDIDGDLFKAIISFPI